MKTVLFFVFVLAAISSCDTTSTNNIPKQESLTSNHTFKSTTLDIDPENISLEKLKQIYLKLDSIEFKGNKKGTFFGEPCLVNGKLTIARNCNNLQYTYYEANDTCNMFVSAANQINYQYRFVTYTTHRYQYIMSYAFNGDPDGYKVNPLLGIIVRDNLYDCQFFVSFSPFRNSYQVPIVISVMQLDSFLYPKSFISFRSPRNISNPISGKIMYDTCCRWQYIHEADTVKSGKFIVYDHITLMQLKSYFDKSSHLTSKRTPVVNLNISYMYLWFWRGENHYGAPKN
ncbi:MAG: hypothetical protein MUC87_22460 [Bacteroidia bacterium]|jgi:hypothetical protein|nr:hypothetical protein [Bacteroidia bacterium]